MYPTKIIIFRDLKIENMHGYELQDLQPDSMIVEAQVIPGMFGFPPVYIQHMSLTHRGERILVVCQTDYEVTSDKTLEVLAGVFEFLETRFK